MPSPLKNFISRLNSSRTIVLYALGIIVFFVIRELIIDEIYSKKYGPDKERFKFSIFIVFLQSVINCIFALIFPFVARFIFKPRIEIITDKDSKSEKKSNGNKSNQKSTESHAKTSTKSDARPTDSSDIKQSALWVFFEFSVPAIAQVIAGYLGNKSMEYVDGTTKTVAKSVKPIPIMVLGLIFRGERYHYLRYIAIFLVTTGVSVFMLELQSGKTQQAEVTAGWIGFSLAAIALFMDGVVGTTQDAVRDKYKPSVSALMFSTSAWAAFLTLLPLWYSEEGIHAYYFCVKYPEVTWELLLVAIATPIGNHFIFLMIHEFGSLQTSIVTTIRKFLTILVNTIWLGRHLSWIQVLAIVMVFGGLEIDNRGKEKQKEQSKKEHAKKE